MRTKISVRTVLIVIALVCVTASLARADKLDLQARLSKNAKIELNDVTIAEALDKIGKKAGVKFVLSEKAAWKLPYGEATRLSLALDGPLAESLTEMLSTFFMRYVVGDDEVTIYPREELEHIIGRPSARQLTILREVYTTPIRIYLGDQPQETVNVGLGREIIILPITVQQQINDLLRQLAGKDPIYTWDRGRQNKFLKTVTRTEGTRTINTQVETVRDIEMENLLLPTPVTLVQLLSQVAADDYDPRTTRWYIGGTEFAEQIPEIRVVGTRTFADLNLNQKVDISYEDYPVDKILGELANRGGVELEIHPQAYLNEHILSVEMKNTTIEQAFRNITGMIGSNCEIHDATVAICGAYESKTPKTKASTAAARRPVTRPTSRRPSGGGDYVGKISIPMDGGKYFIEFMLRENDLTEELKALRSEKMKAIGLKEREKLHPATTGAVD